MKLLMGGCVGYESPRMQQNLNGIYNPAVILKLYKANVQGSAEEELIAFMGLAHLFGGGAYVFILDNELNDHKLLGLFEFTALRNQNPQLTFKKLHNDETVDILVMVDLNRSVYYSDGLHIIHTEKDSAKIVFSTATVFVDHLRMIEEDKALVNKARVSFKDLDNDGVLEIELNEKQEIVKGNWNNPIESKVLKSESRVIYQWDSKRSQYIRNQ
ncbi:MAG: hypothetical protein JKY52_06620 [Flavobacteriales bacterium]|nr:hypothetical protein [Flavobacteriales bacterium]